MRCVLIVDSLKILPEFAGKTRKTFILINFLIPPGNFKVTKNLISPMVSSTVVQSQITGLGKVILVLLIGQKESSEGNK